jgi:hypothetical protein
VTNSAGGGNFTLIASAGASEARISHAQGLESIVGFLDVPDLKKSGTRSRRVVINVWGLPVTPPRFINRERKG